MLALRNLKSSLRLLLLTVFTTYFILYTLNYVDTIQPSQVVPRPSPHVTHYRGRHDENQSIVEVLFSDEDWNVNTRIDEITSGEVGDLTDGNTSKSSAFQTVPMDSEDVTSDSVISDKLELVSPAETIIDQSEDINTQDRVSNEPTQDSVNLEDLESRLKSQAEAYYDNFADLDVTLESGDLGSEENEDELSKTDSKFQSLLDQEQKQDWPIILKFSNASALRHIYYDKYSPKERIVLKSRLNVFEERAQLVESVCKQQQPSLHEPSGANHLVWDVKHTPSIVWCPNYKVASTSMMMSFLRISSKSKKLQKKKRVKQSDVRQIYWTPKSGKDKAKALRESVRVIIVRHPFTRILSAYRDKMTKMKPGPKKFQFRKMQKTIIGKYRPPDSTIKSPFPTFPEFINYVIDETRSLTTTDDWKNKVKCWTTYWAHCNVCTTDYNVIMKLETLDDDKRFLITLSGLEELKEKSPDDWLHLKNATSHDLAPEYYSQLTRDQILSLYHIYKLDFELFDYHIDDYLSNV